MTSDIWVPIGWALPGALVLACGIVGSLSEDFRKSGNALRVGLVGIGLMAIGPALFFVLKALDGGNMLLALTLALILGWPAPVCFYLVGRVNRR